MPLEIIISIAISAVLVLALIIGIIVYCALRTSPANAVADVNTKQNVTSRSSDYGQVPIATEMQQYGESSLSALQ